MKFCTSCGAQLNNNDIYCSSCGVRQDGSSSSQSAQTNSNTTQSTNIFDSITSRVNQMTGGTQEAVRPPLSKIFGQVLKKHTEEEAESNFIHGTPYTTPSYVSNEINWPQPWLWGRILLGLGIAFIFLYLCIDMFGNPNALPGLIILGSFMVPVSVMVFFYELNVPNNISFYRVLKYFIVGGCASLFFTLILYSFINVTDMDYQGATLVGIIEEIGKVGIVAYFISHSKDAKYQINGLLIGAAVGAGFAAFESAGYALVYFVEAGYATMLEVIYTRAILAPGGHVVWAAISGFAIMLAKGDKPFNTSIFSDSTFLKIFVIPIALHAIWDMPFHNNLKYPLLIIASWIVTFVIINNSLAQFAKSINQERLQTDGSEESDSSLEVSL